MEAKHPALPQSFEVVPSGQAVKDPVIDSHTLLADRASVWIRHHGELYRLLLTRNDRLILVK